MINITELEHYMRGLISNQIIGGIELAQDGSISKEFKYMLKYAAICNELLEDTWTQELHDKSVDIFHEQNDYDFPIWC